MVTAGAAFAPLCWTVLLAPLAASLAILLTAIHRRRLASTLAVAGLLTSFAGAIALFLQAHHGHLALPLEVSLDWIRLPGLSVPFGVLIDPLSLMMTLVVAGVGSAIFIYSTGYMADDAAYSRYFGMLSLFAFSMLTIVLATNWIQLFIGWELVGFSSYMLIGHWYAKPSAADAGKKAFMVNRVADFGFLLGILTLWALSGAELAERTFHFQTLQQRIPMLVSSGLLPMSALGLASLLLFCGPVGKSAQFPLHVWLPDAMEGPTPVSALIHAATMVAAGVYLLCRMAWLFAAIEPTATVIMWTGGATALLAAALALVEYDLKRILAYSTLSQLGYMVMAVGVGGAGAAMYHLTTHAFFKALLFLAAGSVIHGTHEQDIRKLGGLWHSMRWTSVLFLIGALALIGFPFTSGFFSKEEVLSAAWEHHRGLFALGLVTAGMTAFYTSRAWFVAFAGRAHGHGHESPPVMLFPMALLAVLSLVGGFLGIPHALGSHAAHPPVIIAVLSIAAMTLGVGLAWLIYGARLATGTQVAQAVAFPLSLLRQRYYLDHIYTWLVLNVQQRLVAGLCDWVEQHLIIGLAVNGSAWLTRLGGLILRRLQTGLVQWYVAGFSLGILWLLFASRR